MHYPRVALPSEGKGKQVYPPLRESVKKCITYATERCGSVVVSTPAWHAADLGLIPGTGMLYVRCKNLVLNTRDCVSPCLSDNTLKAFGTYYLLAMQGEMKYPTQGVNV